MKTNVITSIVCPISVSDLVDKISTLYIKINTIKDRKKREPCRKEIIALAPLLPVGIEPELNKFTKINTDLFNFFNRQQELITKHDWKDIKEEFCEIARKVFLLTMQQHEMKIDIDKRYEKLS
jgi:hypothetical protein